MPKEQTEARLLGKDLNLAAKVIKIAHHGSKYATSENFLKRVQPESCDHFRRRVESLWSSGAIGARSFESDERESLSHRLAR